MLVIVATDTSAGLDAMSFEFQFNSIFVTQKCENWIYDFWYRNK